MLSKQRLLNQNKISAWDILFILWFATDGTFKHTLVGTIGFAVFLCFSFYMCFVYSSWKFPKILVFFLLFVFIGVLNVRLGISIAPKESNFMIGVLLRDAVFVYFFYQYSRHLSSQKLCKLFLLAVTIGSILMLIVNYSRTGSIIMRDTDDSLNGNVMAVCDSIAVLWTLVNKRYRDRIAVICIIICLAFCILAGTRKPLIVIFLGFAIYKLLISPRKAILAVIEIVLVILIGYFVLMKVQFIYDILGNRIESLFLFMEGSEGDGSIVTRDHLIQTGMEYVANNPWKGYGLDCFKEVPGSYGVYSHNNYVELLFSLGIPGLVSFYLMYISLLWSSFVQWFKKRSQENVLAIAFVVCCLLMDYAMVSYFERVTFLRLLIILQLLTLSKTNPSNPLGIKKSA